jgi:hypothetical protein
MAFLLPLLCIKSRIMKKIITLCMVMLIAGKNMQANKDSLYCLILSGKVLQKGEEQFRAYRVELKSGEELIRTIYSDKDENFTLLLKRNMQYVLKLIANGNELKQIFINTHLPWEEINHEHRFDLNMEFPDNTGEGGSKETKTVIGTVNFDPGTRSFFYTCRYAGKEEEGSHLMPR